VAGILVGAREFESQWTAGSSEAGQRPSTGARLKNRKVRSIVTDDFRCETGLQGIRIDYPRERRMSTVIFDISTSLDGSTAVKLPGNAINSETDEVIE